MTDGRKKEIIRLRLKGTGYGTIARTLDIPISTVKSFCRRNNIAGVLASKSSAGSPVTMSCCENCGTVIRQQEKRKQKRFCCDKCRNEWWNAHLDLVKRKAIYSYVCPWCGKPFSVYGNANRKYCSHECYINDRFGGAHRG